MSFKNKEKIIENGKTPEVRKIREDIFEILSSALDAVDPYSAVKDRCFNKKINFDQEAIDLSDFENIYLVGFGKASVGMAQAVCDSIEVKKGVVVTNDPGNKVKNKNIQTIVGGHPIPNEESISGAEKILDVVQNSSENDILIVLISGGGSALLCKPKVELNDLQRTTELLLKSGADINEINTIRKHLSFVKGGQLAKSAKCSIISLIISDIVHDPIEFIASGPTYPDSTTFLDAQNILTTYRIWDKLPTEVKNVLEDGLRGDIAETPKPKDPCFNDVFNFIIANNEIACNAAKVKSDELGYETIILTTSLTGEAKEIGKYLVEKAKSHVTHGKKSSFISGGETTVTIIGDGRGGRNQEKVLAAVEALSDSKVVFASFATDGIDGKSDAAGAIADGFSLTRAKEKNMKPLDFLNQNNSYEFFRTLDDLFITGPTGTNVMDIQILIKS